MMSDNAAPVWPLPSLVKTCTDMMSAPDAIPVRGSTLAGAPPLPAAMPATWVPWLHSLNSPGTSATKSHGAAAPGPICVSLPSGQVELTAKHASSTTFPARNGCVLSTPVSSTAMTTPLPVKPSAWEALAPISDTVCCRNGRSTMSS